MRLIFNRFIIIYLFVLVSSGCSTFTPRKMYDGEMKNKKDVATIHGQKYMGSLGNHVTISIYEVDGKEVFSDLTSISIPYVIQVDPGAHNLTIRALYGNIGSYVFHPTSPTIRVNLKPGQVYQIESKFSKAANEETETTYKVRRSNLITEETVATYKLLHIGSIEQYEDFILKNPNYKMGSPLPAWSHRHTQKY